MRSVRDSVRFWRHAGTGIELLKARFGGHAYDRHAHNTYAIGVTLFGRQGFRHRGRKHVSTAGTIITMNPDDAHDGGAVDQGGFGYWMLYPDAGLWRDILDDASGRAADPPFFADTLVHDPECAGRLLRLCETLADVAAAPLEVDAAVADTLLALAGRHGRSARTGSGGDPGPALCRIRDLLHEGYAREIRLDDLAQEAGCSRFKISRAFAAAYGLPPHAYLTRRRLEAARRLLAQGEPAAEVAAAVGFADQSHLIRRFKASYGITPGEFRAACTPPACTNVQSAPWPAALGDPGS